MKKLVLFSLFALTLGSSFAQKGKFSKPKKATDAVEHFQGHLIDKDTYQYDKDNTIKVGDSVVIGEPHYNDKYIYITEKKGLLDNLSNIKTAASVILPGSTNAVDAVEYSKVARKGRDVNFGVNQVKGQTPNAKYSDKVKEIFGKTLVITEFKEKDFGDGVKEVYAIGKLGKKKYNIVVSSALLDHEMYLND